MNNCYTKIMISTAVVLLLSSTAFAYDAMVGVSLLIPRLSDGYNLRCDSVGVTGCAVLRDDIWFDLFHDSIDPDNVIAHIGYDDCVLGSPQDRSGSGYQVPFHVFTDDGYPIQLTSGERYYIVIQSGAVCVSIYRSGWSCTDHMTNCWGRCTSEADACADADQPGCSWASNSIDNNGVCDGLKYPLPQRGVGGVFCYNYDNNQQELCNFNPVSPEISHPDNAGYRPCDENDYNCIVPAAGSIVHNFVIGGKGEISFVAP